MRASALVPVLSSILLGCPATTVVPPEEGCEVEGPPIIDNLVINSAVDAEAGVWCVCFHLEWVDPADSTGGAPNMHGGLFSVNIEGHETYSEWVDLGEDQLAGYKAFETAVIPEGALEGEVLDFELRMRDRCLDRSNEKRGAYTLGSGKVVEEADATGFQPQQPGVGCDAWACVLPE